MTILTARYLASKLQEKLNIGMTISPVVESGEIAKFIGAQKAVVAARAKELKDERKILSPRVGGFSVVPYQVESIILKLEEKFNGK